MSRRGCTVPLFLAVASGRHAQYLDTLPQLTYRKGSLYVNQRIEFLAYRVVTCAGEGEPVVKDFDLGPNSNGTNGDWSIWILYPVDCTRAQVRAVYDGLLAHNATLPSGSTLGPFAPRNLPAVGKAIIGGVMPMVIAGDDRVAQMEEPAP